MYFLLSVLNMERKKKKKKKRKRKSLGLGVGYIFSFLYSAYYVVIIYQINNFLISGFLTTELNSRPDMSLLIYTLLLPYSSAFPEDGAQLFCQDLKKIKQDPEKSKPHVLIPNQVVITRPPLCLPRQLLLKTRVFQTSADSQIFTIILTNLGEAKCSFALKSS